MLLWTKDTARSGNSDPSNEISCWEFKMLHCIQTNQRTSSTKTSFTVNSKSTRLSFWNLQKFINNILRWCGTINKKQIWMLYTISYKSLSIVFGFVQPNNSRNIEMIEDLNVVFRSISSSFQFTGVVQWSHKGNELSWDNPI